MTKKEIKRDEFFPSQTEEASLYKKVVKGSAGLSLFSLPVGASLLLGSFSGGVSILGVAGIGALSLFLVGLAFFSINKIYSKFSNKDTESIKPEVEVLDPTKIYFDKDLNMKELSAEEIKEYNKQKKRRLLQYTAGDYLTGEAQKREDQIKSQRGM